MGVHKIHKLSRASNSFSPFMEKRVLIDQRGFTALYMQHSLISHTAGFKIGIPCADPENFLGGGGGGGGQGSKFSLKGSDGKFQHGKN